jgi:hypothetical protein
LQHLQDNPKSSRPCDWKLNGDMILLSVAI